MLVSIGTRPGIRRADTRAGLPPSRSLPGLSRTRDAWCKVRTRPDNLPGSSAAGGRSRFRIDTRNCMNHLPGRDISGM